MRARELTCILLPGALAVLALVLWRWDVAVIAAHFVLPAGLNCIYFSYQRARTGGDGSQDAYEFLLGFVGIIMTVFGTIPPFATLYSYWFPTW